MSRGLSSHPVGVENSPLKQIYSPPEKGPSTPPRGELWRPADMPSRPLQVNLLLQHETEGIHTTNN